MNINLQTKKRDRMFNNFFLKYVRKIDEGILREISKIGIEIVDIYEFELLHSDIYKLLFKSSIRTMIRELHEYKEKGELFGKTSEERFNFFENYTDSIEFKKCLDNKYPVLVKIINEYVDNCIIYVTEIISNFYSCKSKLEEAFNVKLSDIKDINLLKTT